MTSHSDIPKPEAVVFLGDIHGEFSRIARTLHRYPGDIVVQVGDMGLGMPYFKRYRRMWVPDPNRKDPEEFDPRFRFIRGNHDDPAACRKYPNYLGDFGVDPATGIFVLSGGESIDRAERIEGRDWWADEQLSYAELEKAIDSYRLARPRVVVSHECPDSVMRLLHSHHLQPSRTSQALEAMLRIHRPDLWVFGHHHKTWEKKLEGTFFVCMAINQARRFPI
jgi:predicted phosphodiesterase